MRQAGTCSVTSAGRHHGLGADSSESFPGPGCSRSSAVSRIPAAAAAGAGVSPGHPQCHPGFALTGALAAACQVSGTGETVDNALYCALSAPFSLPQSNHCVCFVMIKLQMNIKGREVHQNRNETKGF